MPRNSDQSSLQGDFSIHCESCGRLLTKDTDECPVCGQMLEVRPKFPAALRRQRYTTLGLSMYGLFVLALAILLLAIEFDINPYQPPNGRMRLSFPWWMWPVFLISGGLGYFLSGVSVSLESVDIRRLLPMTLDCREKIVVHYQ